MCKSFYSTMLVPSTLSDSNPVSRRFRSIVSICLTIFSLSYSLKNQPTNQPTTRNNEDTPSSLPPPPKKKLTARVEKKEKKRRIKLVSYIYIPIYINPRKEME